jgi:DNA-binding transcriptional ArsR family regulator
VTWAITHYTGHRLLTVVAVLNGVGWLALVQDQPGSREARRVAELPVRSLHLVSGLIGIETIAEVLKELNETAGSPLLRVSSGAGTLRGSRYYLCQVEDQDRPTSDIGQIEPIAPVWIKLGLAAWWTFTVLGNGGRRTVHDLVQLTGLGKSAVYEALRELRGHGLVDGTGGRTATSDAELDELAERFGAKARYAEALSRVRTERTEWKRLLESWNTSADAQVKQVDQQVRVDQSEVENRLGPVPWGQMLSEEPPDDPFERTGVEDQVLQLLECLLGAVRVPPEELLNSVGMTDQPLPALRPSS